MKDITIFIQEALSNTAKKEAEGKMDAWHNGTRKQNIKSCSNEKLIMNYGICIAKGYEKEAAELKAEMDKRGIQIEESLNENKNIDFDEAVEVFRNWLDNDDFADGMSSRTCDGWTAVNNAGGLWGLLDWAAAWDDIAEELGTDEDGLSDWLEKNEDKLSKELGVD